MLHGMCYTLYHAHADSIGVHAMYEAMVIDVRLINSTVYITLAWYYHRHDGKALYLSDEVYCVPAAIKMIS